jgi:glycine/D-amino acid oxidase-like deaminating enzyme
LPFFQPNEKGVTVSKILTPTHPACNTSQQINKCYFYRTAVILHSIFYIRYSTFMQLHSSTPWSVQSAPPQPAYNSLARDATIDVLVLGAGISGALVAWRLQKAGINCMVIDKRAAGMGSTAASTSLVQYELDLPLAELRQRLGHARADTCYQLCYEAIGILENWCEEAGASSLFTYRPSLQFASSPADVKTLTAEIKCRKELGFDVELLGPEDLQKRFSINQPAGILSKQAAQADAYQLTHRLLQSVLEHGGYVHAHSEAINIDWQQNGVVVKTNTGHIIHARQLVVACGYESQRYLPKPVEELFTTYALVTTPVPVKDLWHERSLIWETARPYRYLRTTYDDRILIGGKDDPYDGQVGFPACRRKAIQLVKSLKNLMPHLDVKTA